MTVEDKKMVREMYSSLKQQNLIIDLVVLAIVVILMASLL